MDSCIDLESYWIKKANIFKWQISGLESIKFYKTNGEYFLLIKLYLIELSEIIYFGWLTKIYIKRLHIIFLNGKIMASESFVWTYFKEYQRMGNY